MASSTLFRGRRIVDPVPVQRGPSPRDGKYQSSFSGSTFEWCWNKTRRFIFLWLTWISIIGSITSFCFDHCDLFVSVLAVVKAWLQVVVFCNYTFVYIFYSQFDLDLAAAWENVGEAKSAVSNVIFLACFVWFQSHRWSTWWISWRRIWQ